MRTFRTFLSFCDVDRCVHISFIDGPFRAHFVSLLTVLSVDRIVLDRSVAASLFMCSLGHI